MATFLAPRLAPGVRGALGTGSGASFYRIPYLVLAPDDDLRELLERRTLRATRLMSRGVDTALFTPEKRRRTDSGLNVGYIGRLSPDKSVRVLPEIETALVREGLPNVRFTIVGDGAERGWLVRQMRHAEFTGTLRGEALSAAYADMDLFVFPSETETVGNVVLEALASGVPVVAMAKGGPRSVAGDGSSAVLARNHLEFVDLARSLALDQARRDKMRVAARRHALNQSWDRIFDDVYRGYREAISSAQVGRAQRLDVGVGTSQSVGQRPAAADTPGNRVT